MKSVDRAAAEIRRVDGNHTLGAGALAEALADAGLLMPDEPKLEWPSLSVSVETEESETSND